MIKVSKASTHFISKVYSSSKYAPITLSGVVQHDHNGDKTTTKLPVAFVFHTLYLTEDRARTTLAVTCGANISVNLIIGLPFIKSTIMNIDVNDNVPYCHALYGPPFPLE